MIPQISFIRLNAFIEGDSDDDIDEESLYDDLSSPFSTPTSKQREEEEREREGRRGIATPKLQIMSARSPGGCWLYF